jgi:enoyl-CoA hydratase
VSTPEVKTMLLDRRADGVAVLTINRPEALNALNTQVMRELAAALADLENDPETGCILLTGSDRAFAAGADIKEMAEQDYMDMFAADWFAGWDAVTAFRKPIVAAVAGYALGGGCELAMMCDILIAADTATFGQPEIKLGVMPGMGGSQRLTRAVGKARAMDLILTGRSLSADEAERAGLVSRIVPVHDLLDAALEVSATIAALSTPIAMMAKETINRAFEVTLAEGVRFERRVFHAMFATHDQKEGMAAFVAKRAPAFSDR